MTLYYDSDRASVLDNRTRGVVAYRRRSGQSVRWEDPHGGRFDRRDLEIFDRLLVEGVEHELRGRAWSRESLIAWLSWNDPNGAYFDEDARRDGYDPLTKPEAADLVMSFVRENYETPQEMRTLARRDRSRARRAGPRRRARGRSGLGRRGRRG